MMGLLTVPHTPLNMKGVFGLVFLAADWINSALSLSAYKSYQGNIEKYHLEDRIYDVDLHIYQSMLKMTGNFPAVNSFPADMQLEIQTHPKRPSLLNIHENLKNKNNAYDIVIDQIHEENTQYMEYLQLYLLKYPNKLKTVQDRASIINKLRHIGAWDNTTLDTSQIPTFTIENLANVLDNDNYYNRMMAWHQNITSMKLDTDKEIPSEIEEQYNSNDAQ